MLELDGGHGEGGGQILRTALSCSMITGKPFRIHQIRANRAKPGLQPQHLSALRAAGSLSTAQINGDKLGSESATFQPKAVRAGRLTVNTGTAASTTLIAQTILLPLLLLNDASEVTLTGGTHNPVSPCFEFLVSVFLTSIGLPQDRVALTMIEPGFYPAGGGQLRLDVAPGRLRIVNWTQTNQVLRLEAAAYAQVGVSESDVHAWLAPLREAAGDLPYSLTIRRAAREGFALPAVVLRCVGTSRDDVLSECQTRDANPHSVVISVARQLQLKLRDKCPVGAHLQDQLLLPMAVAGGGTYVTGALTSHWHTQVDTLSLFFPQLEITAQRIDAGHLVKVKDHASSTSART